MRATEIQNNTLLRDDFQLKAKYMVKTESKIALLLGFPSVPSKRVV
jgi:hypothetical protein